MQAGRLRFRVTFQSPVQSLNPFQPASPNTWNDIATVWADIKDSTSNLIFQNDASTMQVSHIITIRYPGSAFVLKAGYRAQLVTSAGTRTFVIQKGMNNVDMRNRQLDLLVWELDPSDGGITV